MREQRTTGGDGSVDGTAQGRDRETERLSRRNIVSLGSAIALLGAAALSACESPQTSEALDKTSEPLTSTGDVVTTIAALRLLTSYTNGQVVIVAGYSTACDGGGGVFYYDSSETRADDGGTIFKPSNNSGNGAWKRVVRGVRI
ncbi:MAG TPA: hypothetical protein VHE30_00485 [Polyangiaceae bacterium]|nr:hypothetical protein [Polyangiaceae bacterium]